MILNSNVSKRDESRDRFLKGVQVVASDVMNDVMGFHTPSFIAQASNKAFISRVACCAQVPTRGTPKAIQDPSRGNGNCRRMSEYIRPQDLIRYKPYVFTCPCTPFLYVYTSLCDVLSRGRSRTSSNLHRTVTFINLLPTEYS